MTWTSYRLVPGSPPPSDASIQFRTLRPLPLNCAPSGQVSVEVPVAGLTVSFSVLPSGPVTDIEPVVPCDT